MGFQLTGISPDRPAKVRETSEKYKFRGPLLSDSRMTAAVAFRLAYEVDETTLQQLKNYGEAPSSRRGPRAFEPQVVEQRYLSVAQHPLPPQS